MNAPTRLAAALRRVADRIDPQPPTSAPAAQVPAEPGPDVDFGPAERGPLSVARERQEERLRELDYIVERNREHDPGSGLAWFESEQLVIIRRLLNDELTRRDRYLEQVLQRGL